MAAASTGMAGLVQAGSLVSSFLCIGELLQPKFVHRTKLHPQGHSQVLLPRLLLGKAISLVF